MAIENLQDGLFKSNLESIYDAQTQINDDRKNLGRDYSNDLIFRNISPSLLRNVYLKDFIVLLQFIMVKYIDTVTYLKIYKSFTLDKNYKKVR